MKRILLVLALLVSSTLLGAPPAAAAELAVNGGFESGSLSPWSCTGNLGSIVTSPVHSGTRALAGAPSSSDNAKCTQTVNGLVSGTSYTLSGWFNGPYTYIGITGGASTWKSSPSWGQLSLTFTASGTSVQIYFHGWYGQSTYYADDISLQGQGGGGGTVPGAPSGMTVTGSTSSSISLSWSAASGTVTGYRIYEGSTQVAQVSGTSATVTGLTCGTSHTYVVRAYNTNGESPNSNSVTGSTTGCTGQVPGVPPNLQVTGSTNSSISLSWGASSGTVTGYRVFEGATQRAQVTGTSATIGGLAACTSHTYTVRAYNTNGESGNSNQASGSTTGCTGGNFKKIAYFTQWGIYARNFKVKNLDTSGMASKLTHIHYAFANLNEQGRCFEVNQLGQGDAWADYQTRFSAADSVDGVGDVFNQPLAGNFNQIKELKAKHPHLKVVLSIGGWTWSKYFSNAALPANRQGFVDSCVDMFIKGNLPIIGGEPQGGPGSAFGVFDGIDIDWEWPGAEGNVGNVIRPEDKANFAATMTLMRNSLNSYGASVGRSYSLSAFFPADIAKLDAGWNVPSLFGNFDYATVQGYDLYGAWEPQTNHQGQLFNPAANPNPRKFSVDAIVNALVARGAPANKLSVGVPAYGRGWTGVANTNNGLYQSGTPAPGTYEAGTEDYDVLKNRAGTIYRDTANGAMWKYDGSTFWSYDDPTLIAQKAQYVRTKGLGGLMMWSTDGDDGTLVTAISNGLA